MIIKETFVPPKPLSKKQSIAQDIWELVKPDLLLLGLIILTAIGAAIIQLQTPLVTGELINILSRSVQAATGSLTIRDLNGPAMKLFGLLSAQGLLTFAHIALVSAFGENVAKRLRSKLFAAIIRQDISFFDCHRSGELVSRLTADVSDFKSTFKQLVTQGLKSVTQTIGSSIQLFRISTSLTLTMLGTMPVLYILLNVYGAYLRKLSKHNKQLDGYSGGVAGEVVTNMRTVRAFASEDREIEHYGKTCNQVAKANQHLGLHIGLFQGLTNISIGCMVLTVLYYGGSLVVENKLTSGDLMSYMLSTQTAQQSLVSLGVLFGQSIKAAASASRVFEFIHLHPNVPLRGGIIMDHVQGDVVFDHIDFSYPSRPDHKVLDGFSLSVPQGTTVALCGPSGSGKSTIASLLERFYEPEDGQILLDGHDLKTLDPSWLRHHIGFINQEPVLFATSILENIRYGRPDATMEEVKEAARQANAQVFIETFPDGYDTVVGERGAALSGGQKQRIAIARAILKDPKILILDEATSALDTQSEKMVQEALDKLMHGRTVLVIAHRLSTIRKADMIVVMGRTPGNILEKGNLNTMHSY
ncbi:P-loop containing nucleoside triphosphate hydrolase protein [Gilbertella persicaria]|uniref:P-loop containing nucleoside triphosphate hydrolase protein n=1 Tax=Gilbertella persicaria TaxID=101096 RepID=UPI00221E81B2|nr:P-loop containing nucleoside triphosphate hydrolase protein [Gilbertella persicaria]KAI8077225.1 P-loop containing nucleoside triphosphate hydrolase protein [Gilbertella persicaria]